MAKKKATKKKATNVTLEEDPELEEIDEIDEDDEEFEDPSQVTPEDPGREPREEKVSFEVAGDSKVRVALGPKDAEMFKPEKTYSCTETEWNTFYKSLTMNEKPLFKLLKEK
jgi:hypothetical protein